MLFTTSSLLAHLLDHAGYRLLSRPQPLPDAPRPMTFDNFGVRFSVTPARRFSSA